jgi:hypothetical protein
MFFKFASNLLQDISDECMLKSFACVSREDAEMYRSIASRIDWLIRRIGVEEKLAERDKEHE